VTVVGLTVRGSRQHDFSVATRIDSIYGIYLAETRAAGRKVAMIGAARA
jgi:hypothetical protein